jgi:glycosyltransferase involved in cell wall biosynthesis
MPKIAIFMNSLSGGGMERAMLNLANFFIKQGASVDLLVASADGPLLSEIPESVNLINLKSSKAQYQSVRWWFLKAAILIEPRFLILIFIKKLPKAVKVIPGLVSYLKDSSPDVILSTPTTANLAVIWAKTYSRYDKKTVVREASTLTEEIQNKNSFFFRMIKQFVSKWYNHADTVICVSEGVKEDLSKNFLVQDEKLQAIYNILDVEKIKKKAALAENNSLIREYGDFVLSIGRLEKQKDFETLIRAFHLIVNNVSVNLVILGEGSERHNLERLIDELSLVDRVHLPGFFINPYPFISKCNVFALSSRWEGCPNVLREALVLQRKIISTDCPSGAKEILHNVKQGRLVPVGNVEKFSQALIEMINCNNIVDSTTAEEMNRKSIETYSKIFSF